MFQEGFTGIYLIRLLAVYALLCIMMAMNLVDVPLLGQGGGRLAVLLAGIYFWSIYRPQLLPYPLVFIGGLVLDFLSGGLVGLHALCFMVMVTLVRGQRRFLLGQSWPVVWAGFCVALAVVTAFQYVAYALSALSIPPLAPVAMNLLISSLIYPLLLPAMMLLNRSLSD